MSDELGVERPVRGLSRRGMLAWAGTATSLAGLGAGGFFASRAVGPRKERSSDGAGEGLEYPFYGEHQAGIITPAQEQLHFAAFDVGSDQSREDLIELLRDWTYAASRLVQGLSVRAGGAFEGNPLAPPDDTREAPDFGP